MTMQRPLQPGERMPPDTPIEWSPLHVGFIGAGNLGKPLAMALAAVGWQVAAVASRTLESAQALAALVPGCRVETTFSGVAEVCDIVFVTTPDDVVPAVAAEVPWRQGQGVVHCSGSSTLDVLDSARLRGAVVGSFHPLQTFAAAAFTDAGEVLDFLNGVSFAVEGSDWLRPALERMAKDLGGRAVHVPPQDRSLYHAAAVMACGYIAALLRDGTQLWSAFDQDPKDALQSLLPLARGTIESLQRVGLPRGVTGPAVRGDLGTLRRHLDAMTTRAPNLLPLYCFLALASMALARERGVSETRVREMEALVFEHLGRFTAASALGPRMPARSPGR